MPPLVFEEHYKFIPPHRGSFWPRLLSPILVPLYRRLGTPLRKFSFHGIEHLKASLAAGHGTILAANHCRITDPFVALCVARQAGAHPFGMGSWHAFKNSRALNFIGPPLGAFSVYREGIDHESIKCAIDILSSGNRPLVLFPEGGISHANPLLADLQEGTAFIARSAAQRRAKATPANKVVIHPVAIRYAFLGDVFKAVLPSIREFERRFQIAPPGSATLHDRLCAVGDAAVSMKEMEYLNETRSGPLYDRLDFLVDAILRPLEERREIAPRGDSLRVRINKLRAKILASLLAAEASEADRQRCRVELKQVNDTQQMSIYPRDYLQPDSPPERFLETVECLEEGLDDRVKPYGPFHVHVRIGPAIPVDDGRRPRQGPDPIMEALTQGMKAELNAAFGASFV